jgi:hypothetical protein
LQMSQQIACRITESPPRRTILLRLRRFLSAGSTRSGNNAQMHTRTPPAARAENSWNRVPLLHRSSDGRRETGPTVLWWEIKSGMKGAEPS